MSKAPARPIIYNTFNIPGFIMTCFFIFSKVLLSVLFASLLTFISCRAGIIFFYSLLNSTVCIIHSFSDRHVGGWQIILSEPYLKSDLKTVFVRVFALNFFFFLQKTGTNKKPKRICNKKHMWIAKLKPFIVVSVP